MDKEYYDEAWTEGEFYELAYTISDLMFGGELAYTHFEPKEFRRLVRERFKKMQSKGE